MNVEKEYRIALEEIKAECSSRLPFNFIEEKIFLHNKLNKIESLAARALCPDCREYKASKAKEMYVVTMYRYGDREKHSYVLGVYSTSELAWAHGVTEVAWRGGKYEPEVLKCEVDYDDIENATEAVPMPEIKEDKPVVVKEVFAYLDECLKNGQIACSLDAAVLARNKFGLSHKQALTIWYDWTYKGVE
jgi:hypothetical protein